MQEEEIFSSNDSNNERRKRPQFGGRFLTDESQIFECNAWDDVEWNDEQKNLAQEKIQQNCSKLMPEDDSELLENRADFFWDEFYTTHRDGFFKDRNWLFTEFPELKRFSSSEVEKKQNFQILEVGCGVGNTIFPLLEANKNCNFYVHCCDFSSTAIDILKKNKSFDPEKCRPFVCDIKQENMPIDENSLDAILMIFVLSALKPSTMQTAIDNLVKFLKPGGLLLFRDYGRYDLAQLRFRNGRCISDNFYARGDKTRVYFFTQEELDDIFCKAGLRKIENKIDRRLQVNRARQLKMYRIWIQCKYAKL